ncbi:MAG: DNA polymerase IV [Clostridia bacterium]|nr:DNA polymerase IV [Clostridia bacterium]
MNSFFCSVELLSHPELKDKPVAVSGSVENRHGIILAKNQLAKSYGVETPEPVWQALKKCPDLVLLPSHHGLYYEYYKKINQIYLNYTDLVEPFSIDESWLDVTASQSLFGDGKKIADEIRERVKKELGLTLSCGVSFNKIFAKMGSDYKKPDATTVISRDNYRDILFPLPAREMFFCGKKTVEKLAKVGIRTIGDIATSEKSLLVKLLGKMGEELWENTNGLNSDPVMPFTHREKPKSLGHGITFRHDITTDDDIAIAVTAIADEVASGLRYEKMKASGVKVDIKDSYFKSISRQKQLLTPTNLKDDIKNCALDLIKENWDRKSPIRLITITGINLVDEDECSQLNLFSEVDEKSEKVERAMDEIRQKFGNSSLSFANILNNDLGINDKNEH